MRGFYDDVKRNVKLAIAIDIVKGKYPIGQRLPRKSQISEIYGVTRVTLDAIYNELVDERVIGRHYNGRSYYSYYVPNDTTAMQAVISYLTDNLKKCSMLLECIGFGAREARNQLFLKQIVNRLPTQLDEMAKKGIIQISGVTKEDFEVVGKSKSFYEDEDVLMSSLELQDVIAILQNML